MVHTESEKPLSREKRIFNECLQRGDDFFKIEIFRSSRFWYLKALEYDTDQTYIVKKISECDRLLKYERKVFIILGIITAGILLAGYFILN